MKVFSILFLAFFIALFNKAHSFCANGNLHADLTRAVVRSSDWMGTFYRNNESSVEPYTASSMISTLRLAGHQPRYLLSEFKDKNSISIEKTLQDYLDFENATQGNLTEIPTGQLAYIVQGVIAICEKPEAFKGFNLYDSLRDGLKWFKKKPTFNNYFQYSLVAIAFCNGGVQVPEIMVDELLNAARQNYTIHYVDTPALILMALSCVKNSSRSSEVDTAITKIVNYLISKQDNATGAFGNQYSTALAVQALQAARHVYTNTWHCEKAMRNILRYQDEDGSFGTILANIQVTPSLLGESLISLSKFNCKTPPPPKKAITVSVNLVFNSTATEPTVNVTTLEGATAYEILELASKQNPCYKAEYKVYSFGRSLKSICGVKANAKENSTWFIYVDGSLAKYGVDGIKPKDGSLLTFRYNTQTWPTDKSTTVTIKNTKKNGASSYAQTWPTDKSTTVTIKNTKKNGASSYGNPAFARVYLMVYFIIYLIH